jgi:hypothetical protein
MAKKAKRGRPPKKAEKKSNNNGPFWRSVGAVGLIVLGVVLSFGAFISAPIPHDLWNGFWWTLGIAAIVAPPALIYLGALKFTSEDQRIPLPNMIGTIGLLVFLASWLEVTFASATHGGQLGATVGEAVYNLLGRFLSSLVFMLLTVFAFIFTFGIEPKSILNLFKREPREETAGDSEDLGALKKKMAPEFQLHVVVKLVV